MRVESERKAIEIVLKYEETQGRKPINVSKKGCGYDISSENRKIEVKGVGESWTSYNWQSLYPSEVECLQKNPSSFYLYIVKFDDRGNWDLYIIPGKNLIEQFKLKITAHSLTPISRRKLKEFIKT